ncbi:hypothetical protein COO60DRAFT_85716 [Scenedesmus sp. NREL 46B-D3]|nr:hypothetical protein COO60DRAFT_85716 [Scenedesmus sp. NREL 46B-D3]
MGFRGVLLSAMAKWNSERKLMACLLVIALANTACAYSPRAQNYRVYEEQRALDVAAAAGSSRPAIQSSPAVAMNPPADDQEDGSVQAPASSTQPRFDALPQTAPAAAPAATAAAGQVEAAADAQQPAVPQLDLESDLNRQRFPASNGAEAAMVWSPDDAWGSWDSTTFEQGESKPTSYSIQLSSFSSGDSPQRVVISGSMNGKSLGAAVAGVPARSSSKSSSSSSSKPAFKPQTLADITKTLGSFGLSVDWTHEDAWKLVQSVEQQVEQQMMSVQGVFDSMLADATEGLVRLESLANGGLFDWQQRMLGLGGGWRRKLKSSSSGAQGQLDVLRLLTSRPTSQQ